MENKYVNVFVTAPGAAEGKKIADYLLKNKLAACASIISGVSSSYWWRGKIEHSHEVLLIMKTRAGLVKELTNAVKKLHSYSVPEIIALPIISGNPDYLKWIGKSLEG